MPLPHHDVRMSGFRQRSTVVEAWNWLDTFLNEQLPETESVPIELAYGRCLGNSITSTIDVPGFDRSAMDGYAVIADETNGASDYNQIRFKVIGRSMPGTAYVGSLGCQQAVRIMTGAPIPDGATAVVPVEFTSADGEHVLVSTTVGPQKHIGHRGEDIQTGATILEAGRSLRPQDVAVLASIGEARVIVRRQPRVRILITGNELVRPGEQKLPHQIYEANSSILLGTIPRDGGVVESLQFIEDSETALSNALLAPGADVILISGGSSVGAEDYAPNLVAQHGELPIHGIAMRPSSPTGIGLLGGAVVILLPGNPVSCLCAYDFFACRAIRKLSGKDPEMPYQLQEARLEKKIVSAIGRVDYCRVKLLNGKAIPLAISGASILSSTTRADGFVIVSENSEGVSSGEAVLVHRYQ